MRLNQSPIRKNTVLRAYKQLVMKTLTWSKICRLYSCCSSFQLFPSQYCQCLGLLKTCTQG